MNRLQAPEPLWVVVVLLALAGLAVVAYALRALDLKGSIASFVFGLIVALVGGLGWLALMALFSAIGVVATRIGYRRKQARRVAEAHGGERGAPNVVANGLAATLVTLALFADPVIAKDAVRLAFATAVAAVAADTMASELGVLGRTARRILPPFPQVPPGENGAVSVPGMLAAAVGATAIACAAAPLVGIPWAWVWIPAVAGFAGCQLDSVLGATLERDLMREGPLSKQDVNFIASAVPALIVLVSTALTL